MARFPRRPAVPLTTLARFPRRPAVLLTTLACAATALTTGAPPAALAIQAGQRSPGSAAGQAGQRSPGSAARPGANLLLNSGAQAGAATNVGTHADCGQDDAASTGRRWRRVPGAAADATAAARARRLPAGTGLSVVERRGVATNREAPAAGLNGAGDPWTAGAASGTIVLISSLAESCIGTA